MKISDCLEKIFITLIFLWSFFNVLTYGTEFIQYPSFFYSINILLHILWILFRLFICLKIILQFEKNDIKILLLILLTFFMAIFNDGGWVSECIWIICGMKKIRINKVISYIFLAHVVGMIIIIDSTLIGLIPDNIILRGNSIRHSLGFNHPNALGARIFQILFMYIYILDDKHQKVKVLPILFISFITYQLTKSITVVLLMALSAVLIFIVRIIRKKEHKAKKIVFFIFSKFKWMFLFIPIIATYVIVTFESIRNYFKGTFLARILQAKYYFDFYGFSLFGKQLEINNGIDNYQLEISKLYTLDNGYMYLLLGYGIIAFTLFLFGNFLLSKRLIKNKMFIPLIIIFIYALYGFAETTMIRFTYNFSVIFFSYILWNNKDYGRVTN